MAGRFRDARSVGPEGVKVEKADTVALSAAVSCWSPGSRRPTNSQPRTRKTDNWTGPKKAQNKRERQAPANSVILRFGSDRGVCEAASRKSHAPEVQSRFWLDEVVLAVGRRKVNELATVLRRVAGS